MSMNKKDNMTLIVAFLILGLILLGIGIFLLYTTHHWYLSMNLPICGVSDKLVPFIDPDRVLKEYFCHDV